MVAVAWCWNQIWSGRRSGHRDGALTPGWFQCSCCWNYLWFRTQLPEAPTCLTSGGRTWHWRRWQIGQSCWNWWCLLMRGVPLRSWCLFCTVSLDSRHVGMGFSYWSSRSFADGHAPEIFKPNWFIWAAVVGSEFSGSFIGCLDAESEADTVGTKRVFPFFRTMNLSWRWSFIWDCWFLIANVINMWQS